MWTGNQAWQVFVPAVRANSQATSWFGRKPAGTSLPISDFFIANPAPRGGPERRAGRGPEPDHHTRHLPAVRIRESDPAHTVILGLGFAHPATGHGVGGAGCADVDGVHVAGLLSRPEPGLRRVDCGSARPVRAGAARSECCRMITSLRDHQADCLALPTPLPPTENTSMQVLRMLVAARANRAGPNRINASEAWLPAWTSSGHVHARRRRHISATTPLSGCRVASPGEYHRVGPGHFHGFGTAVDAG